MNNSEISVQKNWRERNQDKVHGKMVETGENHEMLPYNWMLKWQITLGIKGRV